MQPILKSQPERRAMPQSPAIRSLDQILALADNGQYLPDLLQRNEALISEICVVTLAASLLWALAAGGKGEEE